MTVRDVSNDELRRVIASARSHAAAQREEARRLEAELPALNQRLGAARRRQEHMQRPSTLVTETARERVDSWLTRLRVRRSRA
jgi:hypothetical protein